MTDPYTVRKFFGHMGRVIEKREATQRTKDELRGELTKVKHLAQSGAPRHHLSSALLEFEEKLNKALSNEQNLLVEQQKAEKAIERVTKKLAEIDERIQIHSEIENSRSERYEELENKIEQNVDKNAREMVLVEDKVTELDALYQKVKSTGDYDHKRLDQIKKRLDEFRDRLEKLKRQDSTGVEF